MSPLALAIHWLGFLAPAAYLAVLVASFGRWLGRAPRALSWWAAVLADFVVGAVVLAAGLWFFGSDGKMATYAALVVLMGTAEWVAGQGWRR